MTILVPGARGPVARLRRSGYEYLGTERPTRPMLKSTVRNVSAGLSTRADTKDTMTSVIGSKFDSWSHSDGHRVFAPVRRPAARERSGTACAPLSAG